MANKSNSRARQKTYPGMFRGIVVDNDDPERRGRVRVYVVGVHAFRGTSTNIAQLANGSYTSSFGIDNGPMHEGYQEILSMRDGEGTRAPDQLPSTDPGSQFVNPTAPYPWAEVVAPGSLHTGFTPRYRLNARVWVMFQDQNPDYPVVMGGVSSDRDPEPESRASASDISLAASDSGNRSTKRTRLTSNLTSRRQSITTALGEHLEVSEHPDEQYVQIQSGSAYTRFNYAIDSIESSCEGWYKIRANTVSVGSFAETHVARSAFTVHVNGPEKKTISGTEQDYAPIPLIGFYSGYEAELYARTCVGIGQVLKRELEGSVASGAVGSEGDYYRNEVTQSRMAYVAPRHLFLGIACPETFWKRSHYREEFGEMAGMGKAIFKPTRSTHVGATREMVLLVNAPLDNECGSGSGSTGSGSSKDVIGTMLLRSRSHDASGSEADADQIRCNADGTIDDLEPGSIMLWADGPLILGGREIRFKGSEAIDVVVRAEDGTLTERTLYLPKQPKT